MTTDIFYKIFYDVAWTAPSHYLNQCWNSINWTHRNRVQWNLNRNLYIFIEENALENAVCGMASILSRPQCVKLIIIWELSSCIRHIIAADPYYPNITNLLRYRCGFTSRKPFRAIPSHSGMLPISSKGDYLSSNGTKYSIWCLERALSVQLRHKR